MAVLNWFEPTKRFYEAGVDRGVLYIPEQAGVAWSGLISVDEDPDFDSELRYLDGVAYHKRRAVSPLGGTIQAFFYPEEFEPYAGYLDLATGQGKQAFNFSYRTLKGTQLSEGYRIHILYNVMVAPSSKNYETLGLDPTVSPLSWEFATAHEVMPEAQPSSHMIIDSTIAHPWALQAIEDILYGTDDTQPRCPTPQEVLDTIEENAILQIIDHGDGTWTAIGPDEAISMLDGTTFEITWPTAIFLSEDTYKISSL